MAFDATIAGEDSNSYITLEEANEYASERGHANWDDLDDEDKIAALVNAAEFLDNQYGKRLAGRKATASQYLQFPRLGIAGITDKKDEFGEYILIIPKKVKYAQMELALAYLEKNGSFYSGIEDRGLKSFTNSVGPLMEQKQYFSGASGYETYTSRVNNMLSDYLMDGTFVYRV